ncbi:hypothetical protein [Succinivibrio dextrinosolvens]|uniref:hypothetical protein n=1 Tax=Succinivibrio dextrinosolvens TaxID=83771 RepID=UPI00241BEDDB|nr:hypothetical protein [Succinivibrio dextrinosolvens]MBE6422799.1 HrgA protein [Succinivibrio dextrinosolvens]
MRNLKHNDLNQAVVDFLKENPNKEFSLREIAREIEKKYPDQAREKEKNSNQKNPCFERQFTNELAAHRRNKIVEIEPNIRCLVNPYKLIYSTMDDNSAIEQTNKNTVQEVDTEDYYEKELYPIIIEKLYLSTPSIFSMRIEEKKSNKNKGPNGNKWLHPDIVGTQDLSENWEDIVKETAQMKSSFLKLWSFEVKKEITKSNVREYFFQAVSNSSWANYGYLVAKKIDVDALNELQILCPAHGIGLIHLTNDETDSDDLRDSTLKIMISAVENKNVDWNIINRIARENPDFEEYIRRIKKFNKQGELISALWDLNKYDNPEG